MAELKTKVTTQSVEEYLLQIPNETTRKDCQTLCKLMEDMTQAKAKMWGNAIVGVGDYTYSYSTGRTGDWFMMGFSPRKANISLYIMGCNADERLDILPRLGKHTTGKGCIYVKKLSDINMDVLKEMCEISYRNLKK
ncbi:DUF1801 domain-containing protein [Pedobacter frigiditerrae]|uniref:DUF1801 domain-containing protein n=1 Tax=Pedobacter frigiditerrae TaxID=2530452 RepID=A0A4R0MY10_9SPHI|nr:DUF1801 domain-containing protein [Pedobacter frigiditerrae]TCC92150.1 DUF1801 domain-containing protein [Pedobacter frigiditerrae]